MPQIKIGTKQKLDIKEDSLSNLENTYWNVLINFSLKYKNDRKSCKIWLEYINKIYVQLSNE